MGPCSELCTRTVDHVQQHSRRQEGLWWEIDGENLLRRGSSCAAEDVWSMLWWGSRAVNTAISCVYASVQCPDLDDA